MIVSFDHKRYITTPHHVRTTTFLQRTGIVIRWWRSGEALFDQTEDSWFDSWRWLVIQLGGQGLGPRYQ